MVGIQSANAGPGLLLHEAVSASPFFETDTVPLGQVTEASVSPEPQASVQVLFSQLSCLTTCRPVSALRRQNIALGRFRSRKGPESLPISSVKRHCRGNYLCHGNFPFHGNFP
jgi:hypothetical protein